MYHQFMELAEVDITKEPMEVGPTCHYVMGGIEVDPDTGAAATPGLFAAGECSGGMHGSNRLGGNSLSDLLVFGRRAGLGASDYVRALAERPQVSEEAVDEAAKLALAPFDGPTNGDDAENPYTLHARPAGHDERPGRHHPQGRRDRPRRWPSSSELRERFKQRARGGPPAVQPGLAPGHRPAQHAAGQRVRGQGRAGAHREPRRAHPRRPPVDGLRTGARRCWCAGPKATTRWSPTSASPREDQVPMREDLLELFDIEELEKYFTPDELANHPARRS